MLSIVHDMVRLEAYYIYLLAPGGDRFVLEHVRASGLSSTESGPSLATSVQGLAPTADPLSGLQAPPLDFPKTKEHEEPRLVRDEVGLALLRIDQMERALAGEGELTAGEAKLSARPLPWGKGQ